MTPTNSYIQDILTKVNEGNIVLFLGAGVTCESDGPTGKQLTEMIKGEFPNVNQSLNDLIDVCQDVIETPPYSRKDLENFIIKKLESLQPSFSHKSLTLYDWTAIFTTNYDDLIELSYRISEKRLKPCEIIYTENFSTNPADRSKVKLFKIMGSIKSVEGESGNMVLSRSDYHKALIRRRKYFKILFDFLKSGPIVFIGYSFCDRIVFDVLYDIKEIWGEDRLPWSYALFDKLPATSEKQNFQFSSRKIIPIECSFKNFVGLLSDQIKPIEKVKEKIFTIDYKKSKLKIKYDDAKQYSEYFHILYNENFNVEKCEKENFFMDDYKSWYPFLEGWDFQRDVYIDKGYSRIANARNITGCIKDQIVNELKTSEIEKNKIILIKGMPGVGKTTLLKRIAFDFQEKGVSPIIFIKEFRINFDYKLLDSFISDINRQYDEIQQDNVHVNPIKPIIIIDDASSYIRHVHRLKDYLTSRGRSVLIIAADRSNEWDTIYNKKYFFNLPIENIYEINETLSTTEKTAIIKHFFSLDYIPSLSSHWENIIEKNYECSFFATIYSIVHPSRKPLDIVIKDQYQKLNEISKRAFRYICSFHQFNLPINMELLVRALKCNYTDFISDVINNNCSKVIFEIQDDIGNIFYKSHHRIIADKTVKNFFGDPELLKSIYLEIFSETLLTNKIERDICEKLLIEHIGPNAKTQIFTPTQQKELFKSICENNKIRSLIHHWGLIELDDENYIEGERLLKLALETPKDSIESYRSESDQNILTSLGNLYSKKGISELKNNEIEKSRISFELAESCFKEAKHGDFPNSYAYHAHALMYIKKAEKKSDFAEKTDLLGSALAIIRTAENNLNEDELQILYELESNIWIIIGDDKNINSVLEKIRDQYNSPRGYYLCAEYLYKNATKNKIIDYDLWFLLI
ncbi:MAG: SIR2 family protein [bacterium]